MKKQKIRLLLRSNDHRQLDRAVKDIVRAVKKTGSEVLGPVPLPNRKKVFTVLRSPNNDKKARDQFELSMHKRLLEIEMLLVDPKIVEETMNALMKLQISSSVDVEIK